MFCEKCGVELKENDIYCFNCGHKNKRIKNVESIEKDDNVMLKFGYICEPNAIAYPIFINGKQIELGKTGIFEIQPETFIKKSNINKYRR